MPMMSSTALNAPHLRIDVDISIFICIIMVGQVPKKPGNMIYEDLTKRIPGILAVILKHGDRVS